MAGGYSTPTRSATVRPGPERCRVRGPDGRPHHGNHRAQGQPGYFSTLNYKLQQYAFFGEGTFALTDRFSVTAGVRYYNFKEDKKLLFDGFFVLDPIPVGSTIVSQPGSTKADGFAPRFIVSYKLGDSTTLNAQASKGFRLGGINDPTTRERPSCDCVFLIRFNPE